MKKIFVLLVLLVASLGLLASGAEANSRCGMGGSSGGGYTAPDDTTTTHDYSFCDTFESYTHDYWGKESGSWGHTYDYKYSDSDHDGGSYDSDSYSSFGGYTNAESFTLDLDIGDIGYGGVYLRSKDKDNGVVLVIVGAAGTYDGRTYDDSGFYWHVKKDNVWGDAYGYGSTGYGLDGGDLHLKIVANGDNYSVYIGGYGGYGSTHVSSYSNKTGDNEYKGYGDGHIALYDYTGHNYDNFCVENPGPSPVPEPSTYLLLGSGLLGLVAWRRRQRKKG